MREGYLKSLVKGVKGHMSVRATSCIGFEERLGGRYTSYSQHFLHNFMDMGSFLGAILGTILNYKMDP